MLLRADGAAAPAHHLQLFASMSQSDRQLWIERIARALAELKKEPPSDRAPSGEARDTRQQPNEGK